MRSRLVKLSEPVELVERQIWLWHKRLEHASFGYLKKLFLSLFSSLDVSSFQCDTCELAKSHCVPFPLSSNKSLVSFSLVHSNVWGPAKIATPTGARWFVTFIDDYTCMTWVSLLKTKGEVSSRFQQFYQMVEIQFHARIQVFRFDNGGEFLNHDLNQFFQDHGIIHQRSCPYTPQQNEVVERKNIHLLEVVRASLFGANMPRYFWGEAVVFAAYLINRIPSTHEENRESTTAPILDFFPQYVTLHQNDRLPVESNQSPPLSSSTTENLLQNNRLPADSDRLPKKNDQLSPRCQNQEEEIEPFYEILPASAPVPH
ncbi:hypothetical protein L3X38_005835 [Prunus dulcis]|uniref:Integrase catalytic domain-containing protein n=1 Tax=Prunus dulcis TaxID=3755 RepID=A0AAD4ZRI5_PRUDU|nr:hypothetical protein L3X38_005835 [Prunus dulcis]